MDSANVVSTGDSIECPVFIVDENADDALIQAMERGEAVVEFEVIGE